MNSINVLIPMAGLGTRFVDAGYNQPKPIINVNGKTMIEQVLDNLNINGRYIFIVLEDHWINSGIEFYLTNTKPGCDTPLVGGPTDGAAITALTAKELINNDTPLIIANCDQLVDWNSNDFISLLDTDADGVIATFEAEDPKWSYAEIVDGIVARVAEKEVISNTATVGIYAWKKGSDFVKYAQQMIDKNITTNNEYYICPVYNEAIADGKKIITYPVTAMHGLGTPEDLEAYLAENSTQG